MRAGFGIAAASLVPLIGGLGLLSGALSLARSAAEFEQGIARVANISGAAGPELRQLRDAAIQAGIATSFSPDEAVEGLTALAAQGFNAAQSIGLLNQALALAEGGQIGVEDASRATAAAIRVFNIEGEEATHVADRLLAITNRTALQAGDLTLALGTVSRGAGLTSQNLNEMLISMGLVRNAGVEVSVAASGVSSGLQFIARNAAAFEEIGVSATDAEGNFRGFLDIVAESDVALRERYTNAAERAAAATQLFGRFGVSAFVNVGNQLRRTTGVAEPSLEQMREAVRGLRDDMTDTNGTAERFRDRLLDTFAGQGRLLQGTLQTLGVVLGEPFARVFKPMIKLLTDSLNALLRFFNDLPEPMKTTIAAAIVAAGAFLTLAGALGVIAGLGVVLAPFFVAFVKVLAVLTAALVPVILLTTALGTAIAGMVSLVRNNIGGLGDFFEQSFGRTRLAFQALIQVFTEGGFSGSVRDELNRAENSGLKRFVINLFRIGARIRAFFGGVVSGFRNFSKLLGPRVERLVEALRGIGRAFGFVEESTGGLADTPMDSFIATGVRAGAFLADVLGQVVDIFTRVAQVVGGFISGITNVFDVLSPEFDAMGANLVSLGEEIGALFRELGIFTDEGGSGFETFGSVVGTVVGFIVTGLAFLASAVVGAVRLIVAAFRFGIAAWEPVKTFFIVLGQVVANVFDRMVTSIRNSIDSILVLVGAVVSRIPAAIRPAGLEGISEAATAAQARINAREAGFAGRQTGRVQVVQERDAERSAATAATAAATARRTDASQDIVAELRRQGERDREARLAEAGIPVKVNLDGEVIATAVAAADRRAGARGFIPVPALAE